MPPSEPRDPAGPPSADELLRRLTGTLAHNLNNRLTVIVGTLELALQELGMGSPLANRLQAGLSAGLQAAEMVRRMVMFAYRPGGMPDTSLVSLGEVAENAARRVRDQQRAGLSVEVTHRTARRVRANPLLVLLALEQLVANALEAMPAGGLLRFQVYDEPTAWVSLEVRDTGPGLSDLAAAHLFEPFVTTRSAGHLGLGLVLCRDIVQAQGGDLKLTWKQNEGTCAVISFPGEPGPVDPPPEGDCSPTAGSPETLWHVI